MKVFLLEPDQELADNIDSYLNTLRLKMNIKKVQHEEDIFLEDVDALAAYSLFILNLKNPTDTHVMRYLRENGADAPILVILEPNPHHDIFKTLYYLGYDSIIVKNFYVEEIAFHVYKLCDIWNDDNFSAEGLHFDYKNSKVTCSNGCEVILGKKEALLLKLLFIKSPHIVSFNEIAHYVYEDEVVTEERMRSLVRQLRGKIPHDFIETIKGSGYRVLHNMPANTMRDKGLAKLSLAQSALVLLSTYGNVIEQLAVI